jgi:chemotaxis response regulator CheB
MVRELDDPQRFRGWIAQRLGFASTVLHAGGFTVAQDESTSVIYGMPREAVLLDAARMVLPLDQIGPQIAQLLGDSERRTG